MQNKESTDIRMMELSLRQMEATISLVQYFYSLLISYRKTGISVYSISYLLDLMCQYLMKFYGGDKNTIEDIKKVAEEELKQYCKPNAPLSPPTELDTVKKELKDLGINFNVVYDPKTKTTYPNIDLDKIHIPEKVLDDWMQTHMDQILDSYLKRKKEQENDNNEKKKSTT